MAALASTVPLQCGAGSDVDASPARQRDGVGSPRSRRANATNLPLTPARCHPSRLFSRISRRCPLTRLAPIRHLCVDATFPDLLAARRRRSPTSTSPLSRPSLTHLSTPQTTTAVSGPYPPMPCSFALHPEPPHSDQPRHLGSTNYVTTTIHFLLLNFFSSSYTHFTTFQPHLSLFPSFSSSSLR